MTIIIINNNKKKKNNNSNNNNKKKKKKKKKNNIQSLVSLENLIKDSSDLICQGRPLLNHEGIF